MLPEDPGESPVLPDVRDFMSDEEREKYDEAMQAYYDSGYNEELYPDAEDYMTDEQIDAYTDGKKVAIGATPGYALGINPEYPDYSLTMEFDLANGESRLFENTLNVAPTTILNDGTILAATPMGVCQQAYIKGAGADTFMPLADYFKEKNPEAAEWMVKNLTHDYQEETFDEQGNVTMIDKTGIFTGVAFCDNDLNTIFGGTIAYTWSPDYAYQSYVVTGLSTSVNQVVASGFGVRCLQGGRISISGDADTVEVYDINGMKLFSADVDGKEIRTNLPKGIYVVKVISGNEEKVIKACF